MPAYEQTIQRCPHDRENPYAQINRDLIRDETISPACRWMLIYLLSMQDGWQVNVKQLWNHIKKFHGRGKVYQLLDEACLAGYVLRKDNFKGNLKQGCSYFVSESPKFSKNFSGVPDSGKPQGGKRKEEHIQEAPPAPIAPLSRAYGGASEVQEPSDAAEPPLKKEPPEKAKEMAKKLLDKVKKVLPKFKAKGFEKWPKEFDLLQRKDGHSWDEINEMLDWVFEHNFWYKNILSPQKLREQWDRLSIERTSYSNKGNTEKKNREIAQHAKIYLTQNGQGHLLWIGKDFVRNTKTGDVVNLDLISETFLTVICNWFGLNVKDGQK